MSVSQRPTNQTVKKFNVRDAIWLVKDLFSVTLTTLMAPASYCEPGLTHIRSLHLIQYLTSRAHLMADQPEADIQVSAKLGLLLMVYSVLQLVHLISELSILSLQVSTLTTLLNWMRIWSLKIHVLLLRSSCLLLQMYLVCVFSGF